MQHLPWDVTVPGVPASVQSNRNKKARWRAEVGLAARTVWPAGQAPLTYPLAVTVTCFHRGQPLDTDNMLKPILDALIGIVYDDDKRVVDIHGSMRDLRGTTFLMEGLTPALLKGFLTDDPFVHIKVEAPPNAQELP
jgi:crossover junction endodeoxyribonuclease RusA